MIENPHEFYETPQTFTKWLFRELASIGHPIYGTLFEPCVGNGAILRAAKDATDVTGSEWHTNDLDRRWAATHHGDATNPLTWKNLEVPAVNWTVSNPPFTPAIDIINRALEYSTTGVAMHLRASIHEVLKTGVRRTWMAEHTPTGLLWLPRFAYQRSRKTGEWATDSVCACWVVWLKCECGSDMPDSARFGHAHLDWCRKKKQFIRYAPEWVLRELDAETPGYRRQMDLLMRGFDKLSPLPGPLCSQGELP